MPFSSIIPPSKVKDDAEEDEEKAPDVEPPYIEDDDDMLPTSSEALRWAFVLWLVCVLSGAEILIVIVNGTPK